jgi:glutamate transport system permease protein
MSVLLDNLDLFIRGFLGTIQLFVIAAIGSLVVGGVLAAMRVSPVPFLRGAGMTYVNIVRNTPLTLVLFFFAFAWNRLDIVTLPFFALAASGLIVYTAAFVCEVLRSGVNTVPVGQAEASRALGLNFGLTLSQVVMPQALRAVVPPLVSVEIALLKNTTIAAGFSVVEAGSIIPSLSERGYNVLVGGLWVALGFVILVVPLTLLQRYLERRWRPCCSTFPVRGPAGATASSPSSAGRWSWRSSGTCCTGSRPPASSRARSGRSSSTRTSSCCCWALCWPR